MPIDELSTRTARCRHGVFTYHSQDRFIGTSLRIYGEWSEDEVRMYDAFLKKTDIVIEVGANIGSLTVPLSRRCKEVLAFEPQPQNYELLCANLNANYIPNVEAFPYALGAKEELVFVPTLDEMDVANGIIGEYGGASVGTGSCLVEQRTLDSMKFDDTKIDFIKMDCEGSELAVLNGGEKLITRNWPLIYTENDKVGKSEPLMRWLVGHGYQCFWHRPPLYRQDNFRKYNDNIFGNSGSLNMICYRDRDVSELSSWLRDKVI